MYALLSIPHTHAMLNVPARAEKEDEYSTETGIANPFDTTLFCRSHTGLMNYSLSISKRCNLGFFFYTAKISNLKWYHN